MYSGMLREGCDLGLLTLRLGIGGMLLGLHGWARLVKAFGYLFLGQQWTFIGLVQRMGFPLPGSVRRGFGTRRIGGSDIADCWFGHPLGNPGDRYSIWRLQWALSFPSAAVRSNCRPCTCSESRQSGWPAPANIPWTRAATPAAN